jgi:putative hemolysin
LETDPYLFDTINTYSFFVLSTGQYIVTGLIIVLLLFLSFLVSSSEVVFFSLSSADLKQIRKSDKRSNQLIIKLLNDPDLILATVTTCKSIVNLMVIILATIIAFSLTNYIKPFWVVFVVEFVILFLLILLFEAKLPHSYTGNRSQANARLMVFPLVVLEYLLKPINHLMIYSNMSVGERIIQVKYKITLEELSHILDVTASGTSDINIIKGIVRFAETDVKEIMRSRIDVIGVDLHASPDELLKTILDFGYSRLPVFEESFDNIKGILYIKDILPQLSQGEINNNWQSFIRSAYFVPETRKINDLLKDMQKHKIHMAVIIDEYGGTSGIVTLEDILEEIVGEISDESDEEELFYTKIDSYNYLFEGKTLLNDVLRVINMPDDSFDEVLGDSDTLAGLILDIKGEMPLKGEVINFKNFIFKIESVNKQRIIQIKLTIIPEPEELKDDETSMQ